MRRIMPRLAKAGAKAGRAVGTRASSKSGVWRRHRQDVFFVFCSLVFCRLLFWGRVARDSIPILRTEDLLQIRV